MIDISGSIVVYTGYVDMRKSIDGLAMLVSDYTSNAEGYLQKSDILATFVFVFINRAKDKIKILLKESNGFCLIYKRLDRGCFQINLTAKGSVCLSKQQLRWLLDGLDYATLKPLKSPAYSVIF
jgi:transposase